MIGTLPGQTIKVPSKLLITSYRPDIVVYNSEESTVTALLELTYPLDSERHIEAARSRKQNKTEYLLLAEFDRLRINNYYNS